MWVRQYAKDHPRRGFRPAYHDARGEGWNVNHKKIQRLWREEGLRVPQRRRRKRLGTSTAADRPTADAPNRVWAVDFQFDATTDGRPVKIVSIIDEHTRECLGGLVERSVTADILMARPECLPLVAMIIEPYCPFPSIRILSVDADQPAGSGHLDLARIAIH
jgi:putative transposase